MVKLAKGFIVVRLKYNTLVVEVWEAAGDLLSTEKKLASRLHHFLN